MPVEVFETIAKQQDGNGTLDFRAQKGCEICVRVQMLSLEGQLQILNFKSPHLVKQAMAW